MNWLFLILAAIGVLLVGCGTMGGHKHPRPYLIAANEARTGWVWGLTAKNGVELFRSKLAPSCGDALKAYLQDRAAIAAASSPIVSDGPEGWEWTLGKLASDELFVSEAVARRNYDLIRAAVMEHDDPQVITHETL